MPPPPPMIHLTFQLPNGAAPAVMDIPLDTQLLIVLLRLELLIPGSQASQLQLLKGTTPIPTTDTNVEVSSVLHNNDNITVHVK